MKAVNICAIIIFLLAMSASPRKIIAQNTQQDKALEKKKEQQAKLQDDIKFLDKQIQQTSKSHANTLQELRLIQRKAEVRKRLIERINSDIAIQEKELERKNETLALLQKKLDTLASHYRSAIYKAYQNRDTRLWFMHILASDNLEQGYRRWSYLKNYTRSLNAQAQTLKEVQAQVEAQKAEIAQLKEEKEKEQSAKTKELTQLQKDESTTQKKVQTLSKQQAQLKKELAQKKQQQERLNREIQKMIAAAIAAEKKNAEKEAKKSGGSSGSSKGAYTATPESLKLSADFESNRGRLPWPVKQGVVIEQFGENPHPTLKGVKLPFNNGINISAPRGCNVLSVFNGEVKQIIYIPGYNNCVLVAHGKYFTFYCKLAKVNVKAGQKVTTGQAIGVLESSGSTGELHFEIWNGTTKQNPANWLKQ